MKQKGLLNLNKYGSRLRFTSSVYYIQKQSELRNEKSKEEINKRKKRRERGSSLEFLMLQDFI